MCIRDKNNVVNNGFVLDSKYCKPVSTICCALNQIIIGAFIPDDAKCNLHERAVVNHCNGPIPSVCTTAYAVISGSLVFHILLSF